MVISGVAALAALLSWLASRRSATAAVDSARRAADVARIELERRHDEQQPDWDIAGSEGSDDLVEFTMTIRGPGNSYSVSVEVIPGSVVPSIRKRAAGGVSHPTLDLGEVTVGLDTLFNGHTVKETSGRQRFLVTFESDGAVWRLYKECPISWSPRVRFL